MTAIADAKRGRVIARFGLAAALTAALAIAVVNRDARARATPPVAGVVAPGFAERFSEIHTIRVTAPTARFDVVRAGEAWTLPERDGYRVDAARVAEVLDALASLRLAERKTANPARYSVLGLDDPEEGGDGVRVQAFTDDETLAASVVLGRLSDEGAVYVRRDGEAQTYAARGDRPDISEPAQWLDLTFFDIPREDIAGVRVTGEDEVTYALTVSPVDGGYTLAEPAAGWSLRSARAHGVVSAASRMRFQDVRPVATLPGPPIAIHELRTRDGLVAQLSLFADGDVRWARIDVSAQPPDGADPDAAPDQAGVERAAALAAQTEGWLYRLAPFTPERLVRPLSEIADPD